MIRRIPYDRVQRGEEALLHSVYFNIQLSAPGVQYPRTCFFPVAIDSGATRCLFSPEVADALNLEIEAGQPYPTRGIGGITMLWIHPVTMHIAGESVTTRAAFGKHMSNPGVLGMNGFFSNFNVTFDSRLRECRFERTS